ncbi:hypothetical protein WDH52_06460 [Streptomyces sp. TRM70308]|uniref:hypothetical protein n=1 Tax=Streptomyces sp. TRM70308 TaxID=3131932 RepID=UPI003D0137C9
MTPDAGDEELGPWVAVALPTSEVVTVRLRGWQQAGDGSWWAACRLALWSQVSTPDGERAEPADVDFLAPAARVEPVDGQDYHAVPRVRHRDAVRRRR